MATKQQGIDLAVFFAGAGLPAGEREYRFHPTRKWRWDWCHPHFKVAVERQGATWSGGRHTRGRGYRNDAEKLAAGQLLGWLVLFVTADMIQDGTAIDLVERALTARGWVRV